MSPGLSVPRGAGRRRCRRLDPRVRGGSLIVLERHLVRLETQLQVVLNHFTGKEMP